MPWNVLLMLLSLVLAWHLPLVQAQRRDNKAPTISIKMPTDKAAFTASAPAVTVAGTAKDNVGVTKVTWSSNRGQQGVASGTTGWTFQLPLMAGETKLTVTAHDAAGNQGKDTLTLTTTVAPPPPGPLLVEWVYGNQMGDVFRLERCAVPCNNTMAFLATIALTERQYTDTSAQPASKYCYRMAVVTAGQLGSYSNTLCSP